MGGTEHEFRKRLQTMFAKVKTEKPDASRKQSTEGFFVAVGYKPLKKEITTEDPEKLEEKNDKVTLPQEGLE
jgi:23S rRNA (uridine2552-2'-O)-methyltransferase